MHKSIQRPGLRLRLATSQLIRQWAQRTLPNGQIINGQILNPKTVNYQTLKPERDGLFCERLFGPIQDFVCSCGRQPLRGQKFCPICEVEYTSSRVRRYRLGYIQFVTAVAHVWFFKGRPSFLALFLNLPKKKIECLLYCTENISRTIFPKELENLSFHQNLAKAQQSLHIFRISSLTLRLFQFQQSHRLQKTYSLSFNQNLKIQFFKFNKNLFSKFPREDVHKFQKILCCEYKLYQSSVRTSKFSTNFSKSGEKLFQKTKFIKKSIWHQGGVRDSALYFGFSVFSKMLSWKNCTDWFCCVYFLIQSPQTGDYLNKFYGGPPGIVNFWGLKSRLFCLTGVQLIRTWMTQLAQFQYHDGRSLEIQIRLDLLHLERCEPLSESALTQKIQLFRRLRYLRSFRHQKIHPASMILSTLPVLPPDLRPILQLDRDQIAISDFNKLYQTVLFRNRRLSRCTSGQNFHCLNSQALQYAQRLLQESVDALIDSKYQKTSRLGRPLKSLSDLFKGKKGRFRQNLLGKRVDYSGRSVIVVGPNLKVHECGLPKDIAIELFQPFLIRTLIFRKKVQTILGAKKLLKNPSQFIWILLQQIVHAHPILLNRAPSLHRLSLQAFQPRLISGQAILLHPLVCAAFNADFDGDQMGIHLPLCFEARAEAWKIMWSQNHLFSIATGAPICPPSQDMILGSCFLTMRNFQKFCFHFLKKNFQSQTDQLSIDLLPLLFARPYFLTTLGNLLAINSMTRKGQMNKVQMSDDLIIDHLNYIQTILTSQNSYHLPVWSTYHPFMSQFETETKKQKLIELRLDPYGGIQKFRAQFFQQYHSSGAEVLRQIRTTWGRIKFHQNIE